MANRVDCAACRADIQTKTVCHSCTIIARVAASLNYSEQSAFYAAADGRAQHNYETGFAVRASGFLFCGSVAGCVVLCHRVVCFL